KAHAERDRRSRRLQACDVAQNHDHRRQPSKLGAVFVVCQNARRRPATCTSFPRRHSFRWQACDRAHGDDPLLRKRRKRRLTHFQPERIIMTIVSQDEEKIFARRESKARSYCRSFPTVFTKAEGAKLTSADGRTYIDFLAGCSSLNYGHNDPDMKAALIEHIEADGL